MGESDTGQWPEREAGQHVHSAWLCAGSTTVWLERGGVVQARPPHRSLACSRLCSPSLRAALSSTRCCAQEHCELPRAPARNPARISPSRPARSRPPGNPLPIPTTRPSRARPPRTHSTAPADRRPRPAAGPASPFPTLSPSLPNVPHPLPPLPSRPPLLPHLHRHRHPYSNPNRHPNRQSPSRGSAGRLAPSAEGASFRCDCSSLAS